MTERTILRLSRLADRFGLATAVAGFAFCACVGKHDAACAWLCASYWSWRTIRSAADCDYLADLIDSLFNAIASDPGKRNGLNCNTINGPNYYALPCGRQLEDYLWMRGLNGPLWDAVAYAYRRGKKDGEPAEKDEGKVVHYCEFLAGRTEFGTDHWRARVDWEVAQATSWDGKRIVTNPDEMDLAR